MNHLRHFPHVAFQVTGCSSRVPLRAVLVLSLRCLARVGGWVGMWVCGCEGGWGGRVGVSWRTVRVLSASCLPRVCVCWWVGLGGWVYAERELPATRQAMSYYLCPAPRA
jgi:hypothetical protein